MPLVDDHLYHVGLSEMLMGDTCERRYAFLAVGLKTADAAAGITIGVDVDAWITKADDTTFGDEPYPDVIAPSDAFFT